jgi:hypothetical protein
MASPSPPQTPPKNYNLDNIDDCLELLNMFLNKANKEGVFTLEEANVVCTIYKKVQNALALQKTSSLKTISE